MATDESIRNVFAGRTDNLPAQKSQIVRIFTSSTFTGIKNVFAAASIIAKTSFITAIIVDCVMLMFPFRYC